jgi:hypothetical protein
MANRSTSSSSADPAISRVKKRPFWMRPSPAE